MPGTSRLLPLLFLLPALPVTAGASLCPTDAFPELPTITPLSDRLIHVEADAATLVREQLSRLRGNVVVRYEDLQLEADEADYDYLGGHLDARGSIRLLAPDLLVTGNRLTAQLREKRADVEQAAYFTTGRVNGKAAHLQLDGPQRVNLSRTSFTTCDPADPDWRLSARHLRLDLATRQGTARNVVLRLRDVPVFYLPWLRFPIGDERLTGFLFPRFANSDQLGSQLQLPFYWNIAPNYDATFTPWYMQKRGTMLRSQFRYLHRRNGGQLDADYLGSDRLTARERWGVRWQHRGNPAPGWRTEVDLGRVSDTRYFDDFGTSLNLTSITHLPQSGLIGWRSASWSAELRLQAFQTLNGSPSYERLPQLRLQSQRPERNRRLNLGFDGEWVRFDHPDDVVRGDRLDLQPYVTLPWREEAGFLVPKLRWRHTRYRLIGTGAGQPETPTRSVPTFSLDSGLFFERQTRPFGRSLLQTLEPRLFYVYTPYRDQDALPVFDTAYRTFGINEPVREDFFDGADRVEDANRLTALLTTRLLDPFSGTEYLSASIGQIRYFADQRVALPGQTPPTAGSSNLIGLLVFRPTPAWDIYADATWNPRLRDFDAYNLRAAWQPDSDHRLHLDYRNSRDTLETAEWGFIWRTSPRWRFDGRYLHDLRAGLALEKMLGLRYDSCCWAVGLRFRERFINASVQPDRSLALVLELKGLSSVGTGP